MDEFGPGVTPDEAEMRLRRGRTGQRDSLLLQAMVRRLDDRASELVRVRNLSTGGMMAEVNDLFAAGDIVEVDLRGIGTVGGRVCWREVGRMGIAFDLPIDPRLARKPIATRPAAPVPIPPTVRRPRLFRP